MFYQLKMMFLYILNNVENHEMIPHKYACFWIDHGFYAFLSKVGAKLIDLFCLHACGIIYQNSCAISFP